MKKYIDNIINQTNYKMDCHGLQSKDDSEIIAKHYFERENLSFRDWFVREIPLVDNSRKYPIAICLCVNNPKEKKEITLNLTRDGKLFSINPDKFCEIELNNITDAIKHPTAKY